MYCYEWFLKQKVRVKGFRKAIYSGLTTLKLAEVIVQEIIPNKNLSGLYHIASEPISKYDLLQLIATRYGKKITIEPCDSNTTDRSLDPSLFREVTGFTPPTWPEMIDEMYSNFLNNKDKLYV